MRSGTWRLFLGTLWLATAIALFLRDSWLPDNILQKYPKLGFGAYMALVLCGWNFARWYGSRPRYVPARKPLEPRDEAAPAYEYNPNLDFVGMDREQVLNDELEGQKPADEQR
jgi:hypothetical protein